MIKYTKHVLNWYKKHGFKTKVNVTGRHQTYLRQRVPCYLYFLGPIEFYKEEAYRQVWIEAAKEAKRKVIKYADHYPYNLVKP